MQGIYRIRSAFRESIRRYLPGKWAKIILKERRSPSIHSSTRKLERLIGKSVEEMRNQKE